MARQLGLLAGTFALTLALLTAAWAGLGSPAVTAPTPFPAVEDTSPTKMATAPPATRGPTAAPRATATPRPAATPTPARTPRPSDGPSPTATAGGEAQATYVVRGVDYDTAEVPPDATLTRLGDGSVVLETGASSTAPLTLAWRLPSPPITPGSRPAGIVVRVCGSASGDFWEVYGPVGGEPEEYEVEAPDSAGCWEFATAPDAELTVRVATELRTRMIVERIEYEAVPGA